MICWDATSTMSTRWYPVPNKTLIILLYVQWQCFTQICGCRCVPVDGHHWEAAAAAAGKRIWSYLLSRQRSQHTHFPSKEVCDQSHEFQQGDRVIPVPNTHIWTGYIQPTCEHSASLQSILGNLQRSNEVTKRGGTGHIQCYQRHEGKHLKETENSSKTQL